LLLLVARCACLRRGRSECPFALKAGAGYSSDRTPIFVHWEAVIGSSASCWSRLGRSWPSPRWVSVVPPPQVPRSRYLKRMRVWVEHRCPWLRCRLASGWSMNRVRHVRGSGSVHFRLGAPGSRVRVHLGGAGLPARVAARKGHSFLGTSSSGSSSSRWRCLRHTWSMTAAGAPWADGRVRASAVVPCLRCINAGEGPGTQYSWRIVSRTWPCRLSGATDGGRAMTDINVDEMTAFWPRSRPIPRSGSCLR